MATGNEPIHPAANIFPMMGEEAFAELVADIKQNGQHEPIVYWKEHLLDGRNRIKACKVLCITPDTCELDDDTDPVAYVISANLHRRHLTESQRAMVGAKAKPLFAKQAKERMEAGKKKDPRENFPEGIKGRARDQAGAAVSVSGKLVDAAEKVCEKGSKALQDAVMAGEVSVSKAARVAAKTPKSEQLEAAKAKPKPKAKPTDLEKLCELWLKSNKDTRAAFRKWMDE
jgi:ParB-like chromosome segregation protein Spo0J